MRTAFWVFVALVVFGLAVWVLLRAQHWAEQFGTVQALAWVALIVLPVLIASMCCEPRK
jgi:hypothetical protein